MASVITATKSDEQSSPSGPAFSVVCPVAATPEAIRAGTADLTRMITSEYAEVALESALVTCSLLGQSPANVLAQDVELVAGLVDLVLKSESESTIDTRTAAAQALSMVAAQPSGLNTISSVISARGSRFFEAILKDLDASRKGVETCFLKRFLYVAHCVLPLPCPRSHLSCLATQTWVAVPFPVRVIASIDPSEP